MFELCVPLYGPPLFDVWDGTSELSHFRIREHALYLQLHLFRVAHVVEQLQNANWKLCSGFEDYILIYRKPFLKKSEVYLELERLNIPEDLVEVYEVNFCEE